MRAVCKSGSIEPSLVHEGNGTRQLSWMSVPIKSQREALVKIMTGQEADEGTLWIEEGHFGTARLDGLRTVVLLSWPGANGLSM